MDSRKRPCTVTLQDLHMAEPEKLESNSVRSDVVVKRTYLDPEVSSSTKSILRGIDNGCNGGGVIHLKILVPSVAAGAIIGRGGETIADIQKQAGARVKMSKANDFYPGTNERICLITGPFDAVISIHEFIMGKIREKPDPNAKPAIDFDNKVSAEREKQVKIIIPNSTAGMIIGKAGAFIKQLKEESGAFIQISQKSKEAMLTERVVTVIGEPDNNKRAMTMILSKIQEDPQSGSCLNISYSDVQGLVANFNPTGSPFAQTSNENMSMNFIPPIMPGEEINKGPLPSPFVLPLQCGGSLSLSFNMNPGRPPTDPALMAQYLSHITLMLQTAGYSEAAINEIGKAINCLASHGVLVVSLTPSSNLSNLEDSLSSSNFISGGGEVSMQGRAATHCMAVNSSNLLKFGDSTFIDSFPLNLPSSTGNQPLSRIWSTGNHAAASTASVGTGITTGDSLLCGSGGRGLPSIVAINSSEPSLNHNLKLGGCSPEKSPPGTFGLRTDDETGLS